MFDPNMKRATIIDHYRNPRHYGIENTQDYLHYQQFSNTCNDHFTVALLIINHQLTDIRFSGEGCSLSKASLSIFSELLSGLNVIEAIERVELFVGFLRGETVDNDKLGELGVFAQIDPNSSRFHCVTIMVSVMQKVRDDYAKRI